jgi:hypothetical protein
MGSERDQEEIVTAAHGSAGHPPAGEGSATSRRRRRRDGGAASWPRSGQPRGPGPGRALAAKRTAAGAGPRARWPREEPAASAPDSGYAIRVEGLLDGHWSQWLEGMTITHEGGGVTRIEGALMDEAALHGLLNKLRDLRLPIVTVQRLGGLGSDAPIRRTTGN